MYESISITYNIIPLTINDALNVRLGCVLLLVFHYQVLLIHVIIRINKVGKKDCGRTLTIL